MEYNSVQLLKGPFIDVVDEKRVPDKSTVFKLAQLENIQFALVI